MPITSRDDERCSAGQPVDRLHDCVAIGHAKRAARAEVVLNINHDQSLHRPQYSQEMASRLGTIRDDLHRVLLSPQEAISLEVHGRTDAGVLEPLYLEDGELHAVFTKRREDMRRHPGEISFPGGRYDEGECDLRATALGEAKEEIGLPPYAVRTRVSLT